MIITINREFGSGGRELVSVWLTRSMSLATTIRLSR